MLTRRAEAVRLTHRDARFCLVASGFHKAISEGLVRGARQALRGAGVREERIKLVWVPGSFEIPYAVSKLAQTGRFDAFVALGAILRGRTPQYEIIARETAHGVQTVARKLGVPVTFGIIVAETIAQAQARAKPGPGNRGGEAARSAVELLNLFGRRTTKG